MKTIQILKGLINLLYYFLIAIIFLAVIYLFAIIFFSDSLPFFLQGHKMLFNLSFFNWKMFLSPLSIGINFILFVLAVYYLKKCIKPIQVNDFYNVIVYKNLKKSGRIFILIGLIAIIIKMVGAIYMHSIMSNVIQGSASLLFILSSVVSTIDITSIFLIIMGLFLLVFSSSFENAKKLQLENDLTI